MYKQYRALVFSAVINVAAKWNINTI